MTAEGLAEGTGAGAAAAFPGDATMTAGALALLGKPAENRSFANPKAMSFRANRRLSRLLPPIVALPLVSRAATSFPPGSSTRPSTSTQELKVLPA